MVTNVYLAQKRINDWHQMLAGLISDLSHLALESIW